MGKGAELAPVQLMPAQLMPFKQHRAHNFSAGAAMFDTNVLAHMQRNFLSYDNSGMGLFVSVTRLCAWSTFSQSACHWNSNTAIPTDRSLSRQEMSQRDPGGPVQTCIARAEANLRMLLDIPHNYKVLFFQVSGNHWLSVCSLQLNGSLEHHLCLAGRSPRTVCSCSNESLW